MFNDTVQQALTLTGIGMLILFVFMGLLYFFIRVSTFFGKK